MLERIATLHEIETHWSLSDLFDANLALDIKQDMQRKANAAARNV